MAICTTEYFAGQGKVFVAPRQKGGAINGGWTELGDTSRLEITTAQTFQDIYESCSGTRSIVAHYVTQTDWAFAVGEIGYYELTQSLNNAVVVKQGYTKLLNQYNQTVIAIEFIGGIN